MTGKRLTYAQAGVSVVRGDDFVDAIAPLARRTFRPEVVTSVGGFAALTRIPRSYRRPLLVTSTDGVGTKLLLSKEMRKFDTVGIDLVAMSVNDVLTLGAEPLVFLDYYATGRLHVAEGRDVVRGVAEGCRQAGCALVGGETAEMPQMYRGGDFDLAGFCVGLVDEKKIVDGSRVRAGDVVIGLPSSGVHSNGFSLVRAILRRGKLSLRSRPKELRGRMLGEELLRPTRIYVKDVLRLLGRVTVNGMAHITGSGLPGNLPRVVPDGLNVVVDRTTWTLPAIFRFLQERGNVTDESLAETFNLGIGFAVIVRTKDVRKCLTVLQGARVIGTIVKGKGPSRLLWA